jgi:hypothetical protein
MPYASEIVRTLFNAAVDSHMGDPQGKWSTNTKTEGMMSALGEAAGIPAHLVTLAVMETAIDKWLVCIEETARSYCRHNTAAATLYDTETVKGRERTCPRSVAKLGGLVAEYCYRWYGESPLDNCRDYTERRVAFARWLRERINRSPEVLSFYPPDIQESYLGQIDTIISAAEALRS